VTREGSAVAYTIGQFRDPQQEVARLQQQAAILAAAEEEALTSLGMPARGRVLDVGCGPGFVAARIKQMRPELTVIGIDRDPAVVQRARAIIDVTEATADMLPFPDQHFDCVFARLVMRHVEAPETVMREMFRVLKAGGSAIVIDSDDGALVLHPWPDAFARALAAREQTFLRRHADPFIARRLPALFAAAGFVDLSLRPLVVDSVSVGLAPFARIVLSPVADAIDPDLLDAPGVEAAVGAIDEWSRDPAAFGMTTVVAVGGTKR
jgi:ubiquinone/menaquinone biosynthesis C-methylase UbiE